MTIRVLAIPGSLRSASYNKALLHAAAELAPEGVTVQVHEDLADVPLFNGDVADAGVPAGVQRLRDAIAASDAVLIATPEYNQAVPGVVKNMIDWLSTSDHGGLENRPVAVTGVTTGPWGTRLAQTMLRQMLVSVQALVLPKPALYLRGAADLFDEAGRLADETTRERLAELVSALGDWTRQTRPGRDASDAQRSAA